MHWMDWENVFYDCKTHASFHNGVLFYLPCIDWCQFCYFITFYNSTFLWIEFVVHPFGMVWEILSLSKTIILLTPNDQCVSNYNEYFWLGAGWSISILNLNSYQKIRKKEFFSKSSQLEVLHLNTHTYMLIKLLWKKYPIKKNRILSKRSGKSNYP